MGDSNELFSGMPLSEKREEAQKPAAPVERPPAPAAPVAAAPPAAGASARPAPAAPNSDDYGA
ncbi:hypothetical protein ACCS64_39265, partial [Rhizobium ruizarguesonis]